MKCIIYIRIWWVFACPTRSHQSVHGGTLHCSTLYPSALHTSLHHVVHHMWYTIMHLHMPTTHSPRWTPPALTPMVVMCAWGPIQVCQTAVVTNCSILPLVGEQLVGIVALDMPSATIVYTTPHEMHYIHQNLVVLCMPLLISPVCTWGHTSLLHTLPLCSPHLTPPCCSSHVVHCHAFAHANHSLTQVDPPTH